MYGTKVDLKFLETDLASQVGKAKKLVQQEALSAIKRLNRLERIKSIMDEGDTLAVPSKKLRI